MSITFFSRYKSDFKILYCGWLETNPNSECLTEIVQVNEYNYDTVEPRVSGHLCPSTRRTIRESATIRGILRKLQYIFMKYFSLGSTQHKFYGSSDIFGILPTISHITSTCTRRQSQRYNTTDYHPLQIILSCSKRKWHVKISINGVPG